MSIACKFVLSRSSNIYYSGEEIEGLLTICGRKQYELEAIVLEFYGDSAVQWWELTKIKENIMHNDFSSHEVADKAFYRQQQQHVWQQLNLQLPHYKQLQPHVEYTFRFAFLIPQQLPASYTCFYGRTEYVLRMLLKRIKKANKQFSERIIIKNRLDLTREITYRRTCAVDCFNEFGCITLQLPYSGFTPGQKIPYYLKYQTVQIDCKLLIEFNCYTTCRILNNCSKSKKIKQVIDNQKHLSTETSSFLNIPLHCHSSTVNDHKWLIKVEYVLEAVLLKSGKKVLLKVSMPLTVGTKPCCTTNCNPESFMCFSNWGFNVMSSITHSYSVRKRTNLWYIMPKPQPFGKFSLRCSVTSIENKI